MQLIKEISEQIDEELNDAEKYAKLALKYQQFDKIVADMYHRLSNEEMKHASDLHYQGVRLINDYKASGKTIPAEMQAVYDYLHERHIEHSNQIKIYQGQYNN